MKYKKMLCIQIIILIFIVLLYIIIKSPLIKMVPNCWINETFGILCPSCGATRCLINLLNGNIIKAFKFHPIFFLTIIYLLILDIVYIINTITNKNIWKWIYPKPYYYIVWAIILATYTILRNILHLFWN